MKTARSSALLCAVLATLVLAAFATPIAHAATGVCESLPGGVVELESTGGLVGPAGYATLGAAFADINNGAYTGQITIDVCGDTTEAASAVLNASGTGGASYTTVAIAPAGGASRTIAGAIAGALIDLNGAGHVTIDGIGGNSNALTIDNSSTAATAATIRFIGDASNDTVTNCTLKGSSTGTSTGTIVFATGTATGNAGDTITANTITSSGSNLPVNAIYSAGSSTSVANTGIAITNNNIQDFFSASAASNGIYVASNSAAWTITGNRLFQTATRTSTAAVTHHAINVVTASGGGYVINNNVVGYASSAGTGTTTYGGSVAVLYRAIELTAAASPASELQGNTVTAISFSTTSASATVPGIFAGISVLGGSANIGTTLGNTVGSAATTGAISISSTTTGSLSVGIYASAPGATLNVQNNAVGGITASSATATVGFVVRGIQTDGANGNVTLNANVIGSTSVANSIQVGISGTTTAVTTFVGLLNNATGTISITNNTVQNDSVFGSGASIFQGINAAAASASSVLTITGNSVIAGTSRGTATSNGIVTAANVATANVNSNLVRGMTWNAASGAFRGIEVSGTTTAALNINDNKLGDATAPLMTYNAATSGALFSIYANGGSATAALSVQRNDFRGTAGVATNNEHDYVYVGSFASALTQTISDNTFTNLNVNTSGSVYLVRDAASLPANGTRTISNNAIVTAFNKGAGSSTTSGGIVYGIYDNGFSPATAVASDINNNFSNITVGGTTLSNSVTVFCVRDDDFATKTIQGNTCSNWTGGVVSIVGIQANSGPLTVTSNTISNISVGNSASTSSLTGITVSGSTPTATVSSNTISTLSNSNGSIVGILVNAANSGSSNTGTVTANTISGLTSTIGGNTTGIALGGAVVAGTLTATANQNVVSTLAAGAASSVTGIAIGAATTTGNVIRNKVYDLQVNAATGTVNGISAGGAYNTVQNNLVGDLKTPAASNAGAPSVNGLVASGTAVRVNLYGNTVWITGTSTASPFSTAAVFAGGGPVLTMRNNLLANTATPTGAGHAVALWRSYVPLWNYDTSSNNNDLYAPTAYFDGVTVCPTLSDMWALVYPRESASFAANPPFQSTVGTSPNFLHIVGASTTQLESGGGVIAGLTDDYDGDIRQGNPGYAGTGTAPDVGADEFEGGATSDMSPPAIVYPLLGNGAPYGSRSFTATITDATGVAIASGVRPRVYYRKSTDANDLTGWKYAEAAGSGGSPFTFTIDYSTLNAGGVVVGDTIQYFVVAQDTMATPNVGIYQGAFAAPPASVDLTAAAFPIGGTINSYVIAPAVSGARTVCASGCDYASLTNAGGLFEALNGSVVTGNVVVEILGDSTAETGAVALNQWPEDPAGNFSLTMQPGGGAARTVSGTVAGALIKLNGADRVTIDGLNTGGNSLTISNASTTSGSAIINLVATGSLDAGATNNTIRNLSLVGGANTAGIYGITLSGPTSVSSSAADNDRNTISGNTITRVAYGIWAYGGASPASATNDSLVVSNNTIGPAAQGSDSIGVNGIFINNAATPTISGNVIRNLSATTGSAGAIYLSLNVAGATVTNNTITNVTSNAASGSTSSITGIYLGTLVSNANISGNRIQSVSNTNTTGYGARGIIVNSDGANNTIANNVISDIYSYASTSANSWPMGIQVEFTPSSRVYHNSVNLFGAHPGINSASGSAPIYIGGSVTSVDVRDNVVANTYDNSTSATDKNYGINAANVLATSFSNLDYNDYYVNGPLAAKNFIGNLAGTDYATLTAWQTATGKDANSKAVDPLYTSATDLHLPAASPMLGAGIPLAGFTTDADGNPRSTVRPTIGGYEIASADLATAIIDGPDPVSTGAVTTYTITLTNNGPNVATTPAVTNATPLNTTFVSVTAPAGWSCTTPPVGGTGSVHCSGSSLAVGGTAVITLNVTPNYCVGSLPAPVVSTSDTATASSALPDAVALNTSATENTGITDSGACTDNSVCTAVDFCSLGVCVGSAPLNCDDSVRCTADSCDAATGCQHTVLPQSYTNYADADGDTYGNPATGEADCLATPPAGRVADNTDCNDSNAAIHPGAYEKCDAVDDNCDGRLDDAQANADCNELPTDWACTTNACSPTGSCLVSTVTCDAAGHVFYYRDSTDADSDGTTEDSSTKGVPQVTLALTGDWSSSATSAADGAFSALGGGHVTLTAGDLAGLFTKPDDTNGSYQDGISSLDASLASKSVVGFKTLSPLQRLAADVTGNGRVSSFDASLIAQKAVGIIARFPVATMGGRDSDWAFAPASHTAFLQQSSATGLDFAAVLYGDVSANWGEPANGFAAEPVAADPGTAPVATTAARGRGLGTLNGTATGSETTHVSAGGGVRQALVYLASGPTRNDDGTYTVVLGIANADGILGLDLALHTTLAHITSVRTTGIASNFVAQSNQRDGAMAVSLYSTVPMAGTGQALVITLAASGSNVAAPITVDAEANEGQIPLAIDGTLRVDARR